MACTAQTPKTACRPHWPTPALVRPGGAAALFREEPVMEKWPIGVFASIDAGMGVKLEVARELGVSTIQLHAPAKATRTPERARAFLDRLREAKITLTAAFA